MQVIQLQDKYDLLQKKIESQEAKYAEIAKTLADMKARESIRELLTIDQNQNDGENRNNRVRISNRKDLKSDSSEVLKLNTQNGNFYV